ncbi:LTA synthase family protein [Alkaliphilus serpentinus]|nr:LTA synthase family protein [Alkaliphilus serpentinus]
MNKINIKSTISILAILILSLGLAVSIEIIHRVSVVEALEWLISNKIHFLFNYLIILSIVSAITSLVGCVYIGVSLSGLLLVFLTVVNVYKVKFRGEPLFPWDLLLSNEGTNMLQYITNKSDILLLTTLFLLIIGFGLMRFILPKMSLKIKYRVPLLIISVFLIYSLGFKQSFLGNPIYAKHNIGITHWNQFQSYRDNGFVLAFSLNAKNVIISPPKEYSEDNIRYITQEALNNNDDVAVHNEKDPNLIIIMNEAFWDPTVMENLSFSSDPIPVFRKLHDEYTSGWIRSPQYGGGTSNIEFEVMTGNSMHHLPSGAMAFQQYLGKPTMSLASILKAQGYESIGIHSYEGWFWNRIQSYKNLGFDKFISKEYFTDLKHDGWYIADEVVTDMIIDEIEENDKPSFVYAVTMQNHGPYNQVRYPENKIKVENDISNESKVILETYLQGLSAADRSLEKLTNYLSKSDEPTIVVFFGDHLPMLGYNYSVFTEAGYIKSAEPSEWTYEESLNMERVPILVWANYETEKIDIGTMNTSFISPFLLQYMNMEMPNYFKYLDRLSKKLPVIGRGFAITSDNKVINNEEELFQKVFNDYGIVQYDQFFGNNYLDKDNEDRWIVKNNPKYNEDINNITIGGVKTENNKIVIEGNRFVPNAIVSINGEEFKPTFISPNELELNLSEVSINLENQVEVIVKLKNSKNIVIASSETFILN